MKKLRVHELKKVFIGQAGDVCVLCHHERVGEPYVLKSWGYRSTGFHADLVCWRCCRDAESTLFIFRKWPLAFNRRAVGPYYHLEWAPGVKELVGEHGGV